MDELKATFAGNLIRLRTGAGMTVKASSGCQGVPELMIRPPGLHTLMSSA